MRTIICGSRTILDAQQVIDGMRAAQKEWKKPITEVVAGGAAGPDTAAAMFAQAQGMPLKVFPAPWNATDPATITPLTPLGRPYGRRAGVVRNGWMLNYAKEAPEYGVIAIWDGKSRGTQHMINLALKENVPVYIHRAIPSYELPLEEARA